MEGTKDDRTPCVQIDPNCDHYCDGIDTLSSLSVGSPLLLCFVALLSSAVPNRQLLSSALIIISHIAPVGPWVNNMPTPMFGLAFIECHCWIAETRQKSSDVHYLFFFVCSSTYKTPYGLTNKVKNIIVIQGDLKNYFIVLIKETQLSSHSVLVYAKGKYLNH